MAIQLNLTNVQGIGPGGFNKDFQVNLVWKFTSSGAGHAWLKDGAGATLESC